MARSQKLLHITSSPDFPTPSCPRTTTRAALKLGWWLVFRLRMIQAFPK